MKYIFILCISILVFVGCKKESITNTYSINLGSCKNDIVSNSNNIKICYDSLLYDSRCPVNADCITNGTAAVKLTYTNNTTTVHFKLGNKNNFDGIANDTTINGTNIKLISVNPYPGSGSTVNNVEVEVK